MRISILAALGAAMLAAPAVAQDNKDLFATPMPLPDTKGADPDLACFMVLAAAANDASKAGKADQFLESAAGYYAGRYVVRFPETAAMTVQMRTLRAALKDNDLDKFKIPCIQRYGAALVQVQASLAAAK